MIIYRSQFLRIKRGRLVSTLEIPGTNRLNQAKYPNNFVKCKDQPLENINKKKKMMFQKLHMALISMLKAANKGSLGSHHCQTRESEDIHETIRILKIIIICMRGIQMLTLTEILIHTQTSRQLGTMHRL